MASGPFLERPFWYFEGPIRIPCKPLDILSQHLRPPQGPTRIPLEPHNIHKELQPLPGNNPSWTQNTKPFSPINPYPMPCPGLGCCCKWHCSCSVWTTITKHDMQQPSHLGDVQMISFNQFCNAPNARQQGKVHIHRSNLLQSHLFGGGKNVDIEWDGSCIAQMLQKSMKSSTGEAEIGAATCTSSSNLDFFEV